MKTIKLKDGEAKIGDSIWYVDTAIGDLSGLKSIVLSKSDLTEVHSFFAEKYDCNTPCFCTKPALLAYCQENGIECIELERDVLKERLAELEKPKTDIEKFLALCDEFGINVSQSLMAEKSGITHGSFLTIHDEEMEIRFVFSLYGDFKNFYFMED